MLFKQYGDYLSTTFNRGMLMKLLNLFTIIVSGLFFSSVAFAQAPDPDFDKERDREVSRAKERIQITEDRIKCLQNAKDFEGLKICNQTADKKGDALEAKAKSQAHDKKGSHDSKLHDNKNKQN